MKRLSLSGLLLCTTACGLAHTIDRDMLAGVTVENKLLLFDAENDLAIADDQREMVRRQIREAYRDVRLSEEQIEEAESDYERANAKNDQESMRIALMAEDVFEMKIDYLNAYIGYLRDRYTAQNGLVRVAASKYELAKAKLVKQNKVKGSADIDIEDFEEQVSDQVQAAQNEKLDLEETLKEVNQIREAWLAEREKLREASGGGLGSPWAEDSTLWGSR